MNRREFIINTSVLSLLGLSGSHFIKAADKLIPRYKDLVISNQSISDFEKIISKARNNNWGSLPIGDSISKIAGEFLGTSYVAGTLEGDGPEICRIDLTGLDCVTFVESCLSIARIARKKKFSIDDMKDEIMYIRYRGGKLNGYISRLHYTSDWIFDNENKGVLKDITENMKAGSKALFIETHPNVFFMSKNPKFYQPLKEYPELVPEIASIEKQINSRKQYILPKENIKAAGNYINTGDIIALATNKKGLDYAHIGLAYVKNGVPHLFHASSKKKEVVLDVPIYEYTKSLENITGITILRPE